MSSYTKKYTRSKYSLGTRLKYLEKMVKQNKPEMKFRSQQVVTATNDATIRVTQAFPIGQGVGADARVGNKIKVHKIEVMGKTGNIHAQMLLLLGHDYTTYPGYTQFDDSMGGDLTNNNRGEYKILYNHLPLAHNNSNFRIVKYFKRPLLVTYDGATSNDVANNIVWVVLKNDTGTTIQPSFSIRVWYTDA